MPALLSVTWWGLFYQQSPTAHESTSACLVSCVCDATIVASMKCRDAWQQM